MRKWGYNLLMCYSSFLLLYIPFRGEYYDAMDQIFSPIFPRASGWDVPT